MMFFKQIMQPTVWRQGGIKRNRILFQAQLEIGHRENTEPAGQQLGGKFFNTFEDSMLGVRIISIPVDDFETIALAAPAHEVTERSSRTDSNAGSFDFRHFAISMG